MTEETVDVIEVYAVDDDGSVLCYERKGEVILIGRLPKWVPRVAGAAKRLCWRR